MTSIIQSTKKISVWRSGNSIVATMPSAYADISGLLDKNGELVEEAVAHLVYSTKHGWFVAVHPRKQKKMPEPEQTDGDL